MPINHNDADLSIYRMVLNRLPFLSDNEQNTTLLSNFTLEVMWELERCFQVRLKTDPPDDANVGQEDLYTLAQKSVIADIVSVYVLTLKAAATAGGDVAAAVNPMITFMNRVKAGSVEVGWDQFSVKDANTLAVGASNLVDMIKKDATRKARSLGCIIDICDDCSTQVIEAAQNNFVQPFIVFRGGGDCGCGG